MTITETPTTVERNLDLLAARLDGLRGHKESIEREIAAVQADLLEALIASGEDTHVLDTGVDELVATIVTPQREIVDEEFLVAQLSPSKWRTVSKRVVDKSRLKAAIAIGRIPEKIAAKAVRTEPGTSYVKLTHRPVR
jgi:hypothetical protein